jgi:hypothetical protein
MLVLSNLPRKEFKDSVSKYTSTITVLRKFQGNQVAMKLNGTHQLLVYADDVNEMGGNIDTIKKNTQTLTDASKVVGMEANIERTNHMLLSRHQNTGQNHVIKIANICFENVA